MSNIALSPISGAFLPRRRFQQPRLLTFYLRITLCRERARAALLRRGARAMRDAFSKRGCGRFTITIFHMIFLMPTSSPFDSASYYAEDAFSNGDDDEACRHLSFHAAGILMPCCNA